MEKEKQHPVSEKDNNLEEMENVRQEAGSEKINGDEVETEKKASKPPSEPLEKVKEAPDAAKSEEKEDIAGEEAKEGDPVNKEEQKIVADADIVDDQVDKTSEKEVPGEKAHKSDPGSESTDPKDDEDEEEEEDDDVHHEDEHIDYEHLSKQELVDLIVPLNQEEDMRRVDRMLKRLKPRHDELFHEERDKALKKFLEDEANSEDDFEFKGDELDGRFNDYFNLLKDKRNKFFHDLEQEKHQNLKRKHDVLDTIRELVDGEETNFSFNAIKELQDEWKKIGPVPGGQNKMLWANYNALLDRYYDARSIYFELKDLDRRKNLEAKYELCDRAEALDANDNLGEAITQLNELHEEFKSIGPVPRDDQEALWQRFKAASDKIYAKRKDYVEDLKKELSENLVKKLALCDEVELFAHFESDRISEWNSKTKELLGIQKKWEAIGGMPRDKAKDVNKRFWTAFKSFFHLKHEFFKQFESQRTENLEKKEELVKQAEAVKDSTEWDSTAKKLKELQKRWRDIGPVPEKDRNEIYKRFKTACDQFFDRRRAEHKSQHQEFEENYKEKEKVCEEIEKLLKSKDVEADSLHALLDRYCDIGFVPKQVLRKAQQRFDAVMDMLAGSDQLSDEDKTDLKMSVQISRMKKSPHGGHKLQRKENALKRKIETLQSDIDTYKVNIEFFASSKKSNELKEEFKKKIESAKDEVSQLKQQLRQLNEA